MTASEHRRPARGGGRSERGGEQSEHREPTASEHRRPARGGGRSERAGEQVSPEQGGMPVTEGLEVVIVTGLSGAGRSTAAKCLEDLGYFVVDNLPPELIATMVDLGSRSEGAVTRIAVVMDVRSRAFSTDLRQVIVELDRGESRPRVLFLEASDDVL